MPIPAIACALSFVCTGQIRRPSSDGWDLQACFCTASDLTSTVLLEQRTVVRDDTIVDEYGTGKTSRTVEVRDARITLCALATHDYEQRHGSGAAQSWPSHPIARSHSLLMLPSSTR